MKSSTKSILNKKSLENELNIIQNFNSLKKTNISLIGFENIPTTLSKNGKKFKLNIEDRINEMTSNHKLLFNYDFITYESKILGSSSVHSNLRTNEFHEFSTAIEISSFHSQSFVKKSLYKSFYPLSSKELNTFHSEFETVTHQRNGIDYFYDCLRINVEGNDYDVILLKFDLKSFFVVECLNEQSYDKFADVSYSIRQAIGFINSLMVGGEEFTFDNMGGLYYSNHIRPTIKGMYCPIVTNPYSNPNIEREVAESFYKHLTKLKLRDLSCLVNKIHLDEDFSTAVLVTLEATSTRSLLLIPSSFAVIIELLSKNLSEKENNLSIIVDDLDLKNKIIEELYTVIDKNSESLKEESILKLKNRLKEIARPVNKNKLTNDEKLIRPFEQLDIKLSTQDYDIIRHRNDLLHGDLLLKKTGNKTDEDINLYMDYVAGKLYTLISKLILKSIGYDGYVYNQSKYLEKHIGISTNEEYFEKI